VDTNWGPPPIVPVIVAAFTKLAPILLPNYTFDGFYGPIRYFLL